MQVKSRVWLYSEDTLRRMRNSVHWASMPYRYKQEYRNMIKLLALHGIYDSDGYGEWIHTKKKDGTDYDSHERRFRYYRTIEPPREDPINGPTSGWRAEAMRGVSSGPELR